MKKEITIALLCGALFVNTNVLANEQSGISFRGIPWYSTKAETEKILYESGAAPGGWSSDTNTIFRMSGTDFASLTSGMDRVEGGGCRGWYYDVSVAGYDVANTYACYVYPIGEDGKLIKSDEDAELYFGWYAFEKDDFSDHAAIYDDLKTKLESLYGTAEDASRSIFTISTWHDEDNNLIRLLINENKDYVTLGYMSADADERLDTVQAALDQEKADNESAEREANKDNVSGL